MLGGGFVQSEEGGLADLGISTDSDLSLYIDIHLSGALRAIFGSKAWDGMVQAWLGGKAVATMLLARDPSLGETVSSDLLWFPEQLLVSEERFAETALPREVDDDVHKASL